ncbi:MAG: hypothetical protein ACKN9S_16490 [Pirellula sp.]
MKQGFTVSQITDPKKLLGIGDDWNRLSEISSPPQGPDGGSWDRSFPWLLGWLNELPEQQREPLVLVASSGGQVRGILPLMIHDGPEGSEFRLIGSHGCFGDCKGILGDPADQTALGEAFASYLSSQWIGRSSRIEFKRVHDDDPGILSMVNHLVCDSAWNATSRLDSPARYVFSPTIGPDGEPIWPLASRRTIGLVKKACQSGLFQYDQAFEDTDKNLVIKQILGIRGMIKNDAPELKHRFGAIAMTQRVIDYRFAPGTPQSLSDIGRLGTCNLHWKGNPIAGAVYVDHGASRYVFWMEVRVHPDQEQLIFWMLFSNLIRSSFNRGLRTIQVASHLGARAVGLKNFAARVQTIQAQSSSSANKQVSTEHTELSIDSN